MLKFKGLSWDYVRNQLHKPWAILLLNQATREGGEQTNLNKNLAHPPNDSSKQGKCTLVTEGKDSTLRASVCVQSDRDVIAIACSWSPEDLFN